MVENQRVSLGLYTPVNIAGWKILKMYFLLKMVIFQPAMLVYQRVDPTYKGLTCHSMSSPPLLAHLNSAPATETPWEPPVGEPPAVGDTAPDVSGPRRPAMAWPQRQ